MFEPLNLPIAPLSLSKLDGKIYVTCLLRKKKILLTPEEWVRQHLIHFFISELSYPKGLMSIEKALQVQQLAKRADLVVHGNDGKPVLLVECKAPQVPLNEQTFIQMSNYNRQLQSRYVIASNGILHIVCKIDEFGKISLKEEFPTWSELSQIGNY
jgi:hypothetical protein